MLLAIASQPIDTNTTYTVGADVSRFQRSTVPGRQQAQQGVGGGCGRRRCPSRRRPGRSSASPAATMSRVVPVGAK